MLIGVYDFQLHLTSIHILSCISALRMSYSTHLGLELFVNSRGKYTLTPQTINHFAIMFPNFKK
jgi:hypothetical protein